MKYLTQCHLTSRQQSTVEFINFASFHLCLNYLIDKYMLLRYLFSFDLLILYCHPYLETWILQIKIILPNHSQGELLVMCLSYSQKDVRRIVLRNLNENFFTRCLEGALDLFLFFFFFLIFGIQTRWQEFEWTSWSLQKRPKL